MKSETGAGAFCLLPVCPSPRGDASHGPVYGASLKRELAQGFTLPDTAFPGYRHDCPRPSGRGRRPEAGRGGGCRHIEYRDRGGGFLPPPRLPHPPWRYPPRSSVWGGAEEGASAWVYSPGYGLSLGIATTAPAPRGGGEGRRPGGVGDAGILNPETGEGAFCPLPVCPSPRGDTSHGPGYGEGLKNELVRGFPLPDTALLGYPPPGGRMGWGMPAY